MTLTRRSMLQHIGASTLAMTPVLASQSVLASPRVRKPKELRRLPAAPRVHTVSSLHPSPAHHKKAADHLHKHHKHRHHHKKHVGADNQRALHTLNTPCDRHDLALTMWGEARGSVKKHGENAMVAIGCVILNRVAWDHPATGHGIHGVCHKHKQFSCWNKSDHSYQAMLDLVKLDDNNSDWQMWVLANKIAGKLLAGAYKDITGGATSYFNANVISPYWLKDMVIVGVEYDHTFCKPAPHHPHHAHHHQHHTVKHNHH